MIAMGLMSGTSADGVTAVLGRFQGITFQYMGMVTRPYSPKMVQRIRRGGELSAKDLSQLDMELGKHFGETARHLLKKTRTHPKHVLCIGSHGQTIYHGPNDATPNTLQIADPSVIAEKTRIPVVSHFRQGDMARGGQGAPLIPFFDHFFYGRGTTRALVNIGGMANITIVGRDVKSPLAFDTGPGNSLMDTAMRTLSNGRLNYDARGGCAAKGKSDMAWVRTMLAHPYFRKPPPKSTGWEVFGEQLAKTYLRRKRHASRADILATLNDFTALSIINSFRKFVQPKYRPSEVIVSGGGVYNQTLMKKLIFFFAPIPVLSIEELGLPTLAKEPLAFAFFGLRCMKNQINHLPNCTGAREACVLGRVTRSGSHG